MTTDGGSLQGFDAPDNDAEVSTETEAVVTEQPESEGEVNWQEQSEAQAVKITKLENDLKSQSTGRQSADQRQETVLREIREGRDETALLRRHNEALMKAFASGDNEGLPSELEKINQEAQNSRSSQGQLDAANDLYNQIIDAVVPIAGGDRTAAKTMIETQPEFQTIRDGWAQNAQGNTIDIVGLSGVVAQTAIAVVGMNNKQTAETVRVAENKAAETLEQADVLNLDAGVSSAPADISDSARNLRLSDEGYSWTPDDHKWYAEYRRGQGLR